MIAQFLGGIVATVTLFIVANGTSHFDAATSGFTMNGYDALSTGNALQALRQQNRVPDRHVLDGRVLGQEEAR